MSSPSAYDQYHVLRLVPDLATGEFINVGVLVLSRSQGAVVARVPETPEAFGKVPVAHRRTFAASLDQFFCLLRSVDGFHPLASGLHEGEYRDETDARLLDYMTGVASPLALSEGRRCNATAPHEIAEMLYGSLVKPPCVTAARHSRIDAKDNWEDGYHWKPCMWTCDICRLRYLVDIHFPAINADGVTICNHPSCIGAILQGLEAMRKAGLALHAGRMDAYKLEAGQQLANEFYRQLAQAGGGD